MNEIMYHSHIVGSFWKQKDYLFRILATEAEFEHKVTNIAILESYYQ